MRFALAALFLALTTVSVLAVDPEDEGSTPPEPTPTSTKCPDGEAWDDATGRCIDLDARIFTDRDRYLAARELAYAGRLTGAGRALDAISDQSSSRVLTYRGFIARKSGDWPQAEAYYALALSADPDNVLARAYLGMGLAETGELDAAGKQLREIRNRGGRETWPERALIMSIRSRGVASY